jgi:hypothetical protein
MTHPSGAFVAGLLVVAWLISVPGHAAGRDLVDLIPGLFGGDGITLATTGGSIEHAPHFDIGSAASITQLNSQIRSEIGVFPFSSPGGGFTFSFDPESGGFVRTTETLGPLFAERAPTLGRGKFNLQFAVTFFKYDQFEGNDLDNLEVIARHDTDTIGPAQGGSVDTREDFELDAIRVLFDIDIRVHIFSFAAVYGITDRLDVGILVPLVHIDMDVRATAAVVESPSNSEPGIHTFTGGPEGSSARASGRAFGIGDVLLRAKYRLLESSVVDISGALLLKLPTGDADNFLGTGDLTIRPFLVLSKTLFKRFTPHLNIGYEVNAQNDDRSSVEYAVGFDLGLFKGLTLVGDVIGSYEPDGDGIGDNIVNAAAGLRWNPWAQLVLSVNTQFPLNDEGLRAKIIPTFAVEYSF